MAKFWVTQLGVPPGMLGDVRAWFEPHTTFGLLGSGDAPE